VDVTGGSDEEIDQMGEEFSIHPLALEDCHHQHQRPKVDQYQQRLLLVAYGTEAAIEGEPTRLHELDIVTVENFLVTFHQVPPIDAPAVAKRIQAHPELAHHGAGFLLYVVLDELVDSFVRPWTASASGSRTWARPCSPAARSRTEVFGLRRDLVTIRRAVYGRNFQHMPELRWRLGYPYALGLMLVLAGSLWGFFKRKGWL
jgi:magnesium transporter